MSDVLDNTLPLAAGGDVKQPAESDDGGCFAPFVAPVALPAPKPKPKPAQRESFVERAYRELGFHLTPTAASPETGVLAHAAAGSTGNTDVPTDGPSEILTTPVAASIPPPRKATAVELLTWIKRSILAQTHLPEDAAELVTFWVVSTWFQDALTVLPCLVITGPAHYAGIVLHVLHDLCRGAKLLAGFRRSDLGVLHWECQTNLVSEPNLDKRTANLLSNLTDRNFSVVEGRSLSRYSKSTAIYAGENPGTHKIQNSIYIHIAPTNAAPPAHAEWLQKMTERLPVHLEQYREKNLHYVRYWTWTPTGVPSETSAMATALGNGIVDAPQLRTKLITLLKAQDRQHDFEMSDTMEAVVVEATLALSRDGREHAYVREIATEVNRLLEAHGEVVRLSPEKVGHRLKKLGLRTRPLSQAGKGLTFDKANLADIQELAAVYVMEDMSSETENLHGSQATENK